MRVRARAWARVCKPFRVVEVTFVQHSLAQPPTAIQAAISEGCSRETKVARDDLVAAVASRTC